MAGIASLAIAYILSQFYRSFLAVLTPVLGVELGMTKAELSAASGAWFATFALAQFVVGVSLDRFGPRRTASIMLGVFGAGGAFLFASASAPWMIIAAMALIGIGCAPVLMASYVIFARNYSPARFAVLASWMVGFGTAGNVIGAAPLAAAADAFGWRAVLAGLGVFTLLTAFAASRLVRDPPQMENSGSTGFAGYLELIRLRALWPIIPITAFNYTPVSGIRGLWSGPLLTDLYAADSLLIGKVTVLMALAMVAGSMIYGPLDQLFRTRKWVAVVGNAGTVIALVILASNPLAGLTTLTGLFISIGLTGGAFGLLMAHARAFVPAHLTGRGVTLMNFFSIGGTSFMQFSTGALVASNFDPAEPARAYTLLFAYYAFMVAVSVLVYLLARDAPPDRT